ncbi:tetratricopeptide repeat protein [Uliginosibacterium paludis]|uniref:Tetratricopeptide repeat protein n=1 Tax=Uliginosibacterium paludis TaxID=1615952 RepID=A0ABV2CVK9_9RHOO
MTFRLPAALMTLALCALASLPASAEPTIDQVWQTANAGRVADAEKMMQGVLAAHPASAKAHYVEAELLARERHFPAAREELARAKQLSPGLAFAEPRAVSNLEGLLGERQAAPLQSNGIPVLQGSRPVPAFPWSTVLVLGCVLAFILWAVRFMKRQTADTVVIPAPAPAPAYGTPGYASGAPSYSYGMTPPASGGLGSGLGGGLLGGLATGAAVGAGMVAGEALMHRVLGDSHSSTQGFETPLSAAPDPLLEALGPSAWPNDMGGTDFGIGDTGSWDDSAGSGSSWD